MADGNDNSRKDGADVSDEQQRQMMGDHYDRLLGQFDGLPDMVSTRPTTYRVITPILGLSQTFILQTFRQRDAGDFLFVEYVDGARATRIVFPPDVTEAIARQRDSVAMMAKRKHGRAQADRLRQMNAERIARGEAPAFLKARGGRRRRKRSRKA